MGACQNARFLLFCLFITPHPLLKMERNKRDLSNLEKQRLLRKIGLKAVFHDQYGNYTRINPYQIYNVLDWNNEHPNVEWMSTLGDFSHIIMWDMSAVDKEGYFNRIHWAMYNIPKGGRVSDGEVVHGYEKPNPPRGEIHQYAISLYFSDKRLSSVAVPGFVVFRSNGHSDETVSFYGSKGAYKGPLRESSGRKIKFVGVGE